MSHVLQILNSRDLFSPERAKRFARLADLSELLKVTEQLREAVQKDEELVAATKTDPVSFYRFMASAGMRGDLCELPECRVGQARLLARYGSLYTDQLLVPFWHEPFSSDNEVTRRTVLEGALLAAWELRPLIQAGLAFFVKHDLCYCNDCLSRLVPAYRDILKLAVRKGESAVEKLSFLYSIEDGEPQLQIDGPKEYFDRHGRVLSWEEPPTWSTELHAPAAKKLRLNADFVRKHNLISYVFEDTVDDVTLHQHLSSRLGCKYLTNLRSEADFLERLSNRENIEAKYDTPARLAHSLPILRELPITTLIRLRTDERDSFLLYRTALEKVAREHFQPNAPISARQAEELYNDVFCPDLLRLRARLNSARKSKGAAAFLKTTVAAAVTVTLGSFVGLLPSKLAEWAGTMAGVNAVREVVDTAVGVRSTDPEIRNHELYFLLRASHELEG